ncbi:actin-like ATPase domain-containing protein [Aureobasidium pullulans]|uniref:Actin-like ATPase domain-containing protein n=1 Tax=Aureobasidium pullulans TaxID=5580 RepID=A0A4S8YZA7_AURPU|nr:actin-like ATPase domain-containing protein [Aureobasidium pullulans]
MRRSADRDTIICSIDFGTTFSGASCTYLGKPEPPEKLEPITGWAGGDNCEKVPTQLRYEVTGENIPQPRRRKRAVSDQDTLFVSQFIAEVVEWGFEIDQSKNYIQYLKLLLDPHQQLPSYISRRDLEAQLRQTGKTVIQAAGDYLTKFKEHVLEQIEERFGEDMCSTTKIEFILTVPAVWSDSAKDATLQAAELAGMSARRHNLSMVTEPEAAALCALKTVAGVNANEEDVWIVADSGGGTVDVISYEIKSISPFLIEEAVSGDGDVCGSGLLNIRFKDHVNDKMGTRTLEEYISENGAAWAGCLKHFEERTKRDFDPHRFPEKEYPIPLWGATDDEDVGISANYIVLTTADLLEIFRPVIASILLLIGNQYESLIENSKRPQGLILVGGFGRSKHLFQSLKNNYAAVAPGFEVIRPPHAWSAVAIGAVIHRLEGDQVVQSRISRSHYGVLQRERWNEAKHGQATKVFDEDDEFWYAENRIQWYVKKGQSMPNGDPIVMPFHVTAQDHTHNEVVTLIVSDEDEAPDEFTPTRHTRILCTIPADLGAVSRKQWKVRSTKVHKKKYVVLDYGVGLAFGAGGIVFDMRVGNKVVGTAKADYPRESLG